jgi:hypothetical protein
LQTGRFRLLLSRALLEETLRVLAYPKFRLTDAEIRGLLEEKLIRGIKVSGNDPGWFRFKSSSLSTIRLAPLREADDAHG